ncbi:MAG: hypothetical protein Q8903_04310 [Bacteroidota bacterium]|nr:hypothetical protein [Bacteroidota bacterium]
MKYFMFVLFLNFLVIAQSNNDIQVHFDKDAKIEVGNAFCGIEFHHSYPAPQRISFYYPVANSIDMSTDYWKRDTSFIMSMGLKVNDNIKELIGKTPFAFDLTPYYAHFSKTTKNYKINISYDFCKNKPAFVLTIEIENTSNKDNKYEFFTELLTSLKTCHSYKLVNNPTAKYLDNVSGINFNYQDKLVQNAQVFILNAGTKPSKFSATVNSDYPNNDCSDWINDNQFSGAQNKPGVVSTYTHNLKPKEKFKIVQIIGSCVEQDCNSIFPYLIQNYKDEVKQNENSILSKIKTIKLKNSDNYLQHSIYWAAALLEVNKHYIDKTFQPMPCPAEYNFYFTHDVLLTDLARVNFDLPQVKSDLNFIISHADSNKIIPHAYYWLDSAYTTEYCTPDNWNNFWFIIASASYINKSNDNVLANALYPYLEKSLEQTLLNKQKDNLVWAFRPDWWDIGSNFGPRSYMTILLIKSLRDFSDISEKLNRNIPDVSKYRLLADSIQVQLNKLLWDNNKNYLMNYWANNVKDEHYYMGSLLAAHFDMIDKDKKLKMITTAKNVLLDPKLGIYAAYPMDFDKLIDFLKFAGNEAGDPYYYINGGIWQHANAWYALGLNSIGQKDEALKFIRNTMTVKGIMESPNGQPAMYEYRNGDKSNKNIYGMIDKPQFMWAAGWYLYSLYNIK